MTEESGGVDERAHDTGGRQTQIELLLGEERDVDGGGGGGHPGSCRGSNL